MGTKDVLKNSSASLNVDLSVIIDNYQTLKGKSNTADCAAVVKANAYGIGMDKVAPALYNHTKCRIFFVANLVEGVNLRKILSAATIYVFNGLFPDQVDTYIDHNIRPILNNPAQIGLWQNEKAPCAIHFDTGINRLGLSEAQTDEFLNEKHQLNLSLILSHLVRSEEADHPTNRTQMEKFRKISTELPNVPASIANSGGIFLGPDYHFNLMRPGIMLYGGNPGLPKLPDGIKQSIEIKGKILQIRELDTGMSVGYNAIWTASRPSRIALINVGYADGQLKVSDRHAKVFVAGNLAPVIGKVSMDMVAIDITDEKFDRVTVANDVELLGANITLEMAGEVSTLGQYELLTGIGQRYNKNYNLGAYA